MIAIIPCGGKKLSYAAPAGQIYIGSYHKACMAFALAQHPSAIYILSAKHGLLTLDKVIEPYSQRLTRPDNTFIEKVRSDARRLGITHKTALILGGRAYRTVARAVFPHVLDPLANVAGGIGYQLHWLITHRGLEIHA